MKILMLTASLRSGGAETHICELARALTRRSHSVCIASSGGEMTKTLSTENILHISIPFDSKNPLTVISSTIKLRKLIKKSEFDIIHVHSRIAAFICKIAIGKKDHPCVVEQVCFFESYLIGEDHPLL